MATLQEQLDEALAARHAWITGKTQVAVTFSSGGKSRTIQYSVEGMKQLDAYIAELRRKIAGKPPLRNRIVYAVPD
jgi:site-specific recombinase XerD